VGFGVCLMFVVAYVELFEGEMLLCWWWKVVLFDLRLLGLSGVVVFLLGDWFGAGEFCLIWVLGIVWCC